MKSHLLVLSYQGQKGNFTIKSVKKRYKTLLPDNIKTDVAFQDKQLSSCFNIKDKTELLHKHNLVFHAECPEERYFFYKKYADIRNYIRGCTYVQNLKFLAYA